MKMISKETNIISTQTSSREAINASKKTSRFYLFQRLKTKFNFVMNSVFNSNACISKKK